MKTRKMTHNMRKFAERWFAGAVASFLLLTTVITANPFVISAAELEQNVTAEEAELVPEAFFDVDAPVLAGLSMLSSNGSMSNSDYVTVSVKAYDAGTGLACFYVYLGCDLLEEGEENFTSGYTLCWSAEDAKDFVATGNENEYQATFSLNHFAEAGELYISGIELQDKNGNITRDMLEDGTNAIYDEEVEYGASGYYRNSCSFEREIQNTDVAVTELQFVTQPKDEESDTAAQMEDGKRDITGTAVSSGQSVELRCRISSGEGVEYLLAELSVGGRREYRELYSDLGNAYVSGNETQYFKENICVYNDEEEAEEVRLINVYGAMADGSTRQLSVGSEDAYESCFYLVEPESFEEQVEVKVNSFSVTDEFGCGIYASDVLQPGTQITFIGQLESSVKPDSVGLYLFACDVAETKYVELFPVENRENVYSATLVLTEEMYPTSWSCHQLAVDYRDIAGGIFRWVSLEETYGFIFQHSDGTVVIPELELSADDSYVSVEDEEPSWDDMDSESGEVEPETSLTEENVAEENMTEEQLSDMANEKFSSADSGEILLQPLTENICVNPEYLSDNFVHNDRDTCWANRQEESDGLIVPVDNRYLCTPSETEGNSLFDGGGGPPGFVADNASEDARGIVLLDDGGGGPPDFAADNASEDAQGIVLPDDGGGGPPGSVASNESEEARGIDLPDGGGGPPGSVDNNESVLGDAAGVNCGVFGRDVLDDSGGRREDIRDGTGGCCRKEDIRDGTGGCCRKENIRERIGNCDSRVKLS